MRVLEARDRQISHHELELRRDRLTVWRRDIPGAPHQRSDGTIDRRRSSRRPQSFESTFIDHPSREVGLWIQVDCENLVALIGIHPRHVIDE